MKEGINLDKLVDPLPKNLSQSAKCQNSQYLVKRGVSTSPSICRVLGRNRETKPTASKEEL
jgi:hypothetical protein